MTHKPFPLPLLAQATYVIPSSDARVAKVLLSENLTYSITSASDGILMLGANNTLERIDPVSGFRTKIINSSKSDAVSIRPGDSSRTIFYTMSNQIFVLEDGRPRALAGAGIAAKYGEVAPDARFQLNLSFSLPALDLNFSSCLWLYAMKDGRVLFTDSALSSTFVVNASCQPPLCTPTVAVFAGIPYNRQSHTQCRRRPYYVLGDESTNGDGGDARNATFDYITGVTGDAQGNIYLADNGACVIRMVNTQGIISTVVGIPDQCYNSGDGANGRADESTIDQPRGIVFDNDGNLFISTSDSSTVRQVASGGPTPFCPLGYECPCGRLPLPCNSAFPCAAAAPPRASILT